MRSIPIIIVVILIAAGGIWYALSREEAHDVSSAVGGNVALLSDDDGLELSEREIVFEDGRREFYAEPKTEGAYAGVVMIHEWWGLNMHIKDMARELASEGYRVLAVDLYKGKVASTSEEAQALRKAVKPDESTKILREAASYLREQGALKVASLGWCFGGGKSLELALSGEPLDATVIYYGQPETDAQKLSAIQWPVLGIFGGKDQSIPVSTVESFDAALDSLGITNEIVIYPGVGHAFANPSGANFAPAETAAAWDKTLGFLGEHLKQP